MTISRWIFAFLTACSQTTTTTADAPATDVSPTAADFGCLTAMPQVRRLRFTNLISDLDGTLAVARANTNAAFPPGTLVQIRPDEAMVKHAAGWNDATADWEFFILATDASGTTITARGGAEVNAKLGGSCAACHGKATTPWDMLCDTTSSDHICVMLPNDTDADVAALQASDPRCH